MKFSTAAAAFSLATSAFAAPAPKAQIPGVSAVTDVVDKLPVVKGIADEIAPKLQSGVTMLAAGLGRADLQDKVKQVLSVSNVVTKRDEVVPGIKLEGVGSEQGKLLLQGSKVVVSTLKLDQVADGELPKVEGIDPGKIEKMVPVVNQIMRTMNIKPQDLADVPLPEVGDKLDVTKVTKVVEQLPAAAPAGLLSTLTIPIASLTSLTGLGSILSPLTNVLSVVGIAP